MSIIARSVKEPYVESASAAAKALSQSIVADTGGGAAGAAAHPELVFGTGLFVDLELVVNETGGNTADAVIWWKYADTGLFVEDTLLGLVPLAANTATATILMPATADGGFVEIRNVVLGFDGRIWVIGRGTHGTAYN